jgi:pimeloyl-[acyl-carrier protein] methyl ester esterase
MERSVFDEFSNDLIADWHATIQRFIGLQLHGIEQSRSLIRRATSLLVEGGRPQVEALQVGLQLLLQHDAREELVCLNQPVLAILGARDKLVPRCLADYLAQINARIRVECLPRSAHMPFVSHPQSVAEIIREFIR